MRKRKIVVAITGASGSIYAKVLLDKLSGLQEQVENVSIVMSDNAKDVWRYELGPVPIYSSNIVKLIIIFELDF